MELQVRIMPVSGGWRVDATTEGQHVAEVATQAEAEREAEGYIAAHGGDGFVMVCDAQGVVTVAKRFVPHQEP